MWISAAFGITSKFTECALAVKYRVTNDKGEMLGGPMVTAEVGIPAVYGPKFKGFGKVLGCLFAFFAVAASFGIGNLTQGNSIADAFHNICGVPMWIVGIVVGAASPGHCGGRTEVHLQGCPLLWCPPWPSSTLWRPGRHPHPYHAVPGRLL